MPLLNPLLQYPRGNEYKQFGSPTGALSALE